MNRKLKFRAWTNDCWINEGMLYDYQDTPYVESFGFNTQELPLMQFTGLHDKNGIERYDGDIIKRETGYIFVEEKKYFSLGSKNNAKCYGYDFHENDEVIGNIHENPELL